MIKLWIVSPSFCMFPGHAVFCLPLWPEGNHYYCVNAAAYAHYSFIASTSGA